MTCVRTLAVCLLSAALAAAQSISGDLVVKVADPSQASVAGAKLTLVQVQTNLKQESQTDTQGLALFLQLQPGAYELQVTSAGAQPQ